MIGNGAVGREGCWGLLADLELISNFGRYICREAGSTGAKVLGKGCCGSAIDGNLLGNATTGKALVLAPAIDLDDKSLGSLSLGCARWGAPTDVRVNDGDACNP